MKRSTEEFRIIEYRAPIVNQNANARFASYFSGENLIRYMVGNQQVFSIEEDTYLAGLPQNIRQLPQAGLQLYRKEVLQWRQQNHLADEAYDQFKTAYDQSTEKMDAEYFRWRSPH